MTKERFLFSNGLVWKSDCARGLPGEARSSTRCLRVVTHIYTKNHLPPSAFPSPQGNANLHLAHWNTASFGIAHIFTPWARDPNLLLGTRDVITGILFLPPGDGAFSHCQHTNKALCLVVFAFIQRVAGLMQILLSSRCVLDHFPLAELLCFSFCSLPGRGESLHQLLPGLGVVLPMLLVCSPASFAELG